MKIIILLTALLLSLCSFGQRRAAKKQDTVKKDDFIHTWKLTSVETSKGVSYDVEERFMKFVKDSIFITTPKQTYRGTWILKGGQIQILIENAPQFNYKWSMMSSPFADRKQIWFRIGDDNSILECFTVQM